MFTLFTNHRVKHLRFADAFLSGFGTQAELLDNIRVVSEKHQNYFGISK
jgi:hypothetical protein